MKKPFFSPLLTVILLVLLTSPLQALLPEGSTLYHLGDLPQENGELIIPPVDRWQEVQWNTYIEDSSNYSHVWIQFSLPPLGVQMPAIYLQTINSRLLSAQEYYYDGQFIGRNGDLSSSPGLAREVYRIILLDSETQSRLFMVRFFNDYNELFLPDSFILSIGNYPQILQKVFADGTFTFILAFLSLLTSLFLLSLSLIYRKDRIYLFLGLSLFFLFFYLIHYNEIFFLFFENYSYAISVFSFLTVYYLNASFCYFLGEIIKVKKEDCYFIGHLFVLQGIIALVFYLVNPYYQNTMLWLYNVTTGITLLIVLGYSIRYLFIGDRETKIELRIMSIGFIVFTIGALLAVYRMVVQEIQVLHWLYDHFPVHSLVTEDYVALGILGFFLSMVLVAGRRFSCVYRERSDLLARYDNLVNTMMDGLFLMEEERLVFVNDSFCKILGLEEKELLGRSMFHLFASNHKELFEEILSRIKKGERIREYKMEIETREGIRRTVLFTFVQTSENRNTIQGTVRDISKLQEMEYLSTRDALTGLYNRRYFNTVFFQEIQRVIRNRFNLSLLLIDLDYFKNYNDTYGHQKGDDALVLIGKELLEGTKELSNMVFRVGGEEFAILISGYDYERGPIVAERLCSRIEELKIPHSQSLVSSYLTVSIGVATMGEETLSEKELFELADIALYKAKEEGRNTVVVEKRSIIEIQKRES